MASEIIRLREQAAKARRLAAGLTDPLTIGILNGYAQESDDHAEWLECLDASEPDDG